MKPPLVVAVVGATATGKTALAEALAETLSAEIVCADSRQVYRELRIGTGKPSRAELESRPHHLFDALSLDQGASAGWYAMAAADARARIRAGGRLPLLVGGSGLYLKAAKEGLSGQPPRNETVRKHLHDQLEASGPEALHARLHEVDPATAARLMPRDRQRIVRALEVFESSGRPLSWWHGRPAPEAAVERWHVLEVTMPPAGLRERIAERTRWMLAHGLIEETRDLVAAGWRDALTRLRAVGYDEALRVIEHSLPQERVAAEIDARTFQLAKRQRTWFRHQVDAIRLDASGLTPQELATAALERLEGTLRPR